MPGQPEPVLVSVVWWTKPTRITTSHSPPGPLVFHNYFEDARFCIDTRDFKIQRRDGDKNAA